MDMLLQAVVVGLAAWRVSSLFVNERGPFSVFEKLREAVGIVERPLPSAQDSLQGALVVIPETLLAGIFSCVWCMSVYMTAILWCVYEIEPLPVFVIAGMAMAVITDRITTR